mmetsp:Transcript_7509/g.21243  ORF Transcript_7509/g.21243 Transcript_7509/m.21243 type:complete len:297 (+) Transcript_7509:51-941(+)
MIFQEKLPIWLLPWHEHYRMPPPAVRKMDGTTSNQLHEIRGVKAREASRDPALVDVGLLGPEKVPGVLIEVDLAVFPADERAKNAELLQRLDTDHLVAPHQAGIDFFREDALHKDVRGELLFGHRLKSFANVLAVYVVAATLALRLNDIVARIGNGILNSSTRSVVLSTTVERPKASERAAKPLCVLRRHKLLELARTRELLLHLFGSHKVVLDTGALDRARALQQGAGVPLLLARVVVGGVPRAVVHQGHALVINKQGPLVALEPGAGCELCERAADGSDTVGVPELVLKPALIE